jgi:hypothetical protein
MRLTGIIKIFGPVFLLSTANAHAVQISLSGGSIDRYFLILEHYILPLMVVSTIVLFCGYLASRIYHRTVQRKQPDEDDDDIASGEPRRASSDDGTAAFLRELRATPPIEDPEPQREPKGRTHHPFLRKRSANAAAALRAQPPIPYPEPTLAPPGDAAGDVRLAAGATRPTAEPRRPASYEPVPAAPAEREPFELKAEPRPRAPMPPAPTPAPTPDAGLWDDAGRAAKAEPTLAATAGWWKDADGVAEPANTEPSATVLQALKAGSAPLPADVESARVRASEIGDSMDYATSVLQQAATLVTQRISAKQGLALDDVRGMRIAGFDQPQGVLEDLRKLGGDVAEEVLAAYQAVARFDGVLRRLEQMTVSEPLDEGWNDLLRARISDTLYAVGQVRKTLGGYRLGVKKPGKPGDGSARPSGASGAGADQTVPVGRRQL